MLGSKLAKASRSERVDATADTQDENVLPRSSKFVRDKRKSMKRARRDIKLRGNTECFDNFALRIQLIGVHDFLRGTQQYPANKPGQQHHGVINDDHPCMRPSFGGCPATTASGTTTCLPATAVAFGSFISMLATATTIFPGVTKYLSEGWLRIKPAIS